jgi:DNA polymerase III alpha subunit
MRFLTLEDRTGTVEAVLFPAAYRRFGHLLRGAGPYLLRGRMEDAHGAPSLTVEEVAVVPTE